jgi:molybdopterin converting factor small subunit
LEVLSLPLTVNIDLYGVVRDLVKDTRIELQLPEGGKATFRVLLDALAERYGPALRDRLFDRHGVRSHVTVLASGRVIKDLDETLPSGDEPAVRVIIFAAAGGG